MTGSRHGEIAAQWWRELAKPKDPRRRGAGRSALAQLRRASTPIEALMEPATIDLARRLSRVSSGELGRVGIVAAVLAHVRDEETAMTVARACGPASDDADDGELKYGRFRRLLLADDNELIDQMRRLVHLLKRRVNAADLADSILYWGDGVRKRWVLDYYRADRQSEARPAEPAANA